MTAKQSISADFPYKPNYAKVHGANIHYVDEGLGDPILFIHGNPTSSYLWRNIIPYLKTLGRCLALDLVGMGKSDKLDIDYRFFDHVKYLEGFIESLKLKNITLVMHDWGSALGFYYAMRHESNIKGLAFMEAILMPWLSWEMVPLERRETWQADRAPEVGWDRIVNKNMFIEQYLPKAVVRRLTEAEMSHYREPFKDTSSRKPIWRWRNEIPIEGEPSDVVEVVESYNQWLQRSELPKLLLYATPGLLIQASMLNWCKQHLNNLSTVDIGIGIHYVQEDNPHLIGSELANWYKRL